MQTKSTSGRITNWETWPFKVIYAPLIFAWLYYSIKARAIWFFSNVNPTLEFSGFEGETKKEMYDQLPKELFPETIHISKKLSFIEVTERLAQTNIKYPLIVKPEVGMQGILFRKIDNQNKLLAYHNLIPADYVIQDFVDLELEFSIFHIRYPGKEKGIVTGFIQKEYMSVIGDGRSNLLALIRKHPKARLREDEMKRKHQASLQSVFDDGEKYILSIAGNHNRGARFINLHNEIDEQLCNVFDKLSVAAKEFYFGRYDVKSSSIEDLKQGKNLSILEFNGAGAEPNHIYDCDMSYPNALKEIARHWKYLYEIGKINKKRGIEYWSFWKGYRHLQNSAKFFKHLKQYDNQHI